MELSEVIESLEHKLYKETNNDSWYWQEEIELILEALKNSIPKNKIEELIKEELPDDKICEVCDIYDVNGVDIRRKLEKILEE